MPGGFRLGEFEDAFQVADAHFAVGHDQVEDAEPRGIRAGEENLCAKVDIEMLQSHVIRLRNYSKTFGINRLGRSWPSLYL